MKDLIFYLSNLAILLWCGFVLWRVPEAPNGPPRTSRYWLAHKLFGGKRLWMMLAGAIPIGIASRFILDS